MANHVTTEWEDIHVKLGNYVPTEKQTESNDKIQEMAIEAMQNYDPLENKTVEQLQQLTNIDITQSLQIVTTNLINEKSYEKAKILCDDFLKATRDDALKDTIYTMKKNIRNYEIGDMVLKGLSMDKSDDKQIEYFELIEKGLIKGNVKLSSIPLGTSKDGLKKIYLSDIMDINELER